MCLVLFLCGSIGYNVGLDNSPMTQEVRSAEIESYNFAKAVYQPVYEQLIEDFNYDKEYIKDEYMCGHFARDTMEYFNKLGYKSHIETGYYNGNKVHHAINVLYIPISNGEVLPPSYMKDWNQTMWYGDLNKFVEKVNYE